MGQRERCRRKGFCETWRGDPTPGGTSTLPPWPDTSGEQSLGSTLASVAPKPYLLPWFTALMAEPGQSPLYLHTTNSQMRSWALPSSLPPLCQQRSPQRTHSLLGPPLSRPAPRAWCVCARIELV